MPIRYVGKEGLSSYLLTIVFVLAGLGFLARPAHAGTITVGWDLMVEPNVTGYRVLVGTRSRTYTQTFDVPADKDFFIFRNAFMGVRYFFVVSAQFDNATYGPQSAEVTSVGTRTVAGQGPLLDGARVELTAASECGVDCFVVSDLARGLGEIASLAAAPDGSVFAVESGRRVVLLRAGTVVTAFEAEAGTILREVALDPQFASTGRVFVSLLRPHDRASGDVEVLRLRHLAGALGEPATVVTGPSVPLAASVPFTAGDDGLLYLALPSLLGRHPYSAAILAFDQDGRVPEGQASPVLARGFDEPVDMAWDAETRALLLVGRNAGADTGALSVSRAAGAVVSNIVAAGEPVAAVAVAPGAARRLLVATGVDLVETVPETRDALRISLEAYGTPVAIAAVGGARYVATRVDSADEYRVLKVEDSATRSAR